MKTRAWPTTGLAHDTGRLYWGMWLCGCSACIDACRAAPDVLLVVRACGRRQVVTASQYAEGRPAGLMSDAPEEVFVANQWNGRFPPRSVPMPKKARRWSPPLLANTCSPAEDEYYSYSLRAKIPGSPPPTAWIATCPCGDDPITCEALEPVRDLAMQLHGALLTSEFDRREDLFSPEVRWGAAGTRDAITGRADVLARFQALQNGHYRMCVIEVRVEPGCIQMVLEVFLPYSENLAVVQGFRVDDGMITEIEGPAVRQFRDTDWRAYDARRCPYCGSVRPTAYDDYLDDEADDRSEEEEPSFEEELEAWG